MLRRSEDYSTIVYIHEIVWARMGNNFPRDGKFIGFKDGNSNNCQRDNLYLVDESPDHSLIPFTDCKESPELMELMVSKGFISHRLN